MSDFLSLSCPSCGGALKSLTDQPNSFICEHCENEYLLKQSGNAVTLHRISENVLNVGSSSTVVQAQTVYMAAQPIKDIQSDNAEIVECPICGKRTSKDETFRCKICQRSDICLSHQDGRSYACSECFQRVKDGLKQRPSYWKAIVLNILGGFGLFYVDRKSKRKWLYPSLIILPVVMTFLLVSVEDAFGFYFHVGGLFDDTMFLFISIIAYPVSFIDVLTTCYKKRKAIAKQFVL